jgi:SHS2 domain-containing protein
MATGKRTPHSPWGAQPCAGASRRHASLPHTADAGFTAEASTLPELLEEAAVALAALTEDLAPDAEATIHEEIRLAADDLVGLAYAWLNELIAVADIHHGAIVTTSVERVVGDAEGTSTPRWRLRGRVGLRGHGESGVRIRGQVKSATYHGLKVEHDGGCWTMQAYVDM